jgi:dolichol-phosphate mannosyltransferase
VIAPTYNESENVGPLVAEISAALKEIDHEILIVDDDSPDRTWARAQAIARELPQVRVLRRTRLRGLGYAVIDGFSCAKGELVACIDADLQHNPAILPDMVKALDEGADLAVASRYLAGGGTGQWNLARRFASWVATKTAQCTLGIKLCDPMSGYFMLRRRDFLRVRNTLDGLGFKILLELVAHMKPRSVREVPYTFRPRVAGKSKLSSKIIFEYLHQLWRLSPLERFLPAEFASFALVGATGIIVNLGALAAIVALTGCSDWRASASATLLANISNYIFNNAWTFRSRAHAGKTLLSGYVRYLVASLVGVGLTTACYALITHLLPRVTNPEVMVGSRILLLSQFAAIVVGTYFNYTLNRTFTWPKRTRPSLAQMPAAYADAPETAVDPAASGAPESSIVSPEQPLSRAS